MLNMRVTNLLNKQNSRNMKQNFIEWSIHYELRNMNIKKIFLLKGYLRLMDLWSVSQPKVFSFMSVNAD